MHALHGLTRARPLDWSTVPAAVVCSKAVVCSIAIITNIIIYYLLSILSGAGVLGHSLRLLNE